MTEAERIADTRERVRQLTARIFPDTPKRGITIIYTAEGVEVDATNAEILKRFIPWAELAEGDYRMQIRTRGGINALDAEGRDS